MDPTEFTEFLKRFSPLGVQWVVEWWHITDMVNQGFKDNCVPVVGFRHCSYDSTCRIVRQLVTVKELLVTMGPSKPWHLLRGS